MTIQLKLTKFEINYISNKFEVFESELSNINFVLQTAENKLILSICSNISDKFYTKSRATKKDVKKKTKPYLINVKWHEAYALKALIHATTIRTTCEVDTSIGHYLQMLIGEKL